MSAKITLSKNKNGSLINRSYTNTEFSLFLGPINTLGPEQSNELTHRTNPTYAYSASATPSKYKIEYSKKPRIINNYYIGNLLGQGTFGKIREAYDIKNNRYVAVKILNKKRLSKTYGGEKNIKREIFIMSRLKHPNVMQLFDVFENDEESNIYIAMELVGGGSLQTMLEKCGRLSDGEAKWYFKQLISGLEYIHNKGIIHRDIKPSNLMLTNNGILKISDFGVSELIDKNISNKAYDLIEVKYDATPFIIPPEIATGSDYVSGFKVDVWAVGVTLYLLVTGNLPFHGSTLFNLYESISKGEYSIPDWIDEDLKNLIYHLLEPNEIRRYTIEQIKTHPWLNNKDKKTNHNNSDMANGELDNATIKDFDKESESIPTPSKIISVSKIKRKVKRKCIIL